MDINKLLPKGRIVDLTHRLVPGKEQYALDVGRHNERQGDRGDIMSTVYFWSHVGTHVEAPLHYLAKGSDTAGIPIEKLMGPAVVLDFRSKAVNEAITLEDVKNAAKIEVGDRVMTMTGRHVQFRTPQSHERPFLTEEAVRWLVEDRRISFLGTDSSGYEVRGVSHHPDHLLITGAEIPVLECMANLVELKSERFFLIALPIPVVGLDACPVRAVGIVPEG